jgi:hypothetical protein
VHGVEEALEMAHQIHLALGGMEIAEAVAYLVHSGILPEGMIGSAAPIALDAGAVALAWYAGTSIGCTARALVGDQLDWFLQAANTSDWIDQYYRNGHAVAPIPPIQYRAQEETTMRVSGAANTEPPPAIPNAPELREGCGPSYSDWVTHLQGLLQQLGLYGGAVDGDFGWRTTEAVKAFQQQAGLQVDGVVGDKTWYALMS